MSKSYDEYATQLTRRLSPEGRAALRVFHGAHAMGQMLCEARAQRGYTQQQCRICPESPRPISVASSVAFSPPLPPR